MTLYEWSLVGIASSWLIRLTMIPVVVMRKESPSTSLAWLMIVFFEPWIGLMLYVLLGEDRLVRRRLKLRSRAARRFHLPSPPELAETDSETDSESEPADGDKGPQQDAHDSRRRTLASLARGAGALPVTDGNAVELIAETSGFIEGIVRDIDSAQLHVHLMFYIVENDEVGRAVGEALIRARQRGVECRLLADAVGARSLFGSLARRLTQHGVEVLPSLPANLIRRGLARLDMRNHRKLAVIDGCVAWTGSQNIVEESYGHSKAGVWHDLMARITGTAVGQLQVIFLEDWYHETELPLPSEEDYFPQPTRSGSVALQVVPTGPDRPTEHFQHLIVEAIHSAQNRVTITSPYFIPDEPLMCALRLAAARGVQVEVIVPDRSDHRIVDAAGRFYCSQLLDFGVDVFLFEDGLLHSKTLTIDDGIGMFGSANYDIRSFQLNFELNILLYDEHATCEVRKIQQRYKEASRLLTKDEWDSQSRWKHLACNVAKLFSPLL
jgi:cardiolipin synthase A/B